MLDYGILPMTYTIGLPLTALDFGFILVYQNDQATILRQIGGIFAPRPPDLATLTLQSLT